MAIDQYWAPSVKDYLGELGLTLRYSRGWRTSCPLCGFDSLVVRSERLSCDDCGFSSLTVLAFHARLNDMTLTEAAKALGCWLPDDVRTHGAA